jgi:LysM repeat protein
MIFFTIVTLSHFYVAGWGKMDAKPFFVLFVFILFIAVFASGAIGNANLTDGGQSQVVGGASTSSGEIDYNVFAGGSSSSASAADTPGTAANSSCGSAYTVKTGDTLSRIAQDCGVSLQDLLAANPSITNANLITVGQKIAIRPAAPIVKSAASNLVTPSATPQPAQNLIPGIIPGEKVTAVVQGFPPYAEVQVGVGKVGEKPVVVETGRTGADGSYKVAVTVPQSAKANEKWTVTITMLNSPKIKVTAVPFDIGAR